MNFAYRNQECRGPIFASPQMKQMFDIVPEAIDPQGYLVPGVSFEGKRGEKPQIVAKKRAPMIKWTVSFFRPTNERLRLKIVWDRAIMRNRSFRRYNRRNEIEHIAEMVFALPFSGQVKIYAEGKEEDEDVLLAVMQNVNGEILVEMYQD